uniref:Uncharacterized protein n=1 Tax=Timema tahoe TaxID=61484 RepID=A0A7R9NVR5_9NEOP|nr:unnamed protein product [Timema tahoe]
MRRRHPSTFQSKFSVKDEPLFNPELLKRLNFSHVSKVFNPPISAAHPGESLVVRPLCRGDYDRGYLKLLSQLTKVGHVSREQFYIGQLSSNMAVQSLDHGCSPSKVICGIVGQLSSNMAVQSLDHGCSPSKVMCGIVGQLSSNTQLVVQSLDHGSSSNKVPDNGRPLRTGSAAVLTSSPYKNKLCAQVMEKALKQMRKLEIKKLPQRKQPRTVIN